MTVHRILATFSFVLDNMVETIVFVRVNINMDTVPTMSRLPCKYYYKMRTVSVIQHAHCAGTCSFTVLCKSNESKFQRNFPNLCDISKKANFRSYYDAPIVPISLKFRANARNFSWHFVSWMSKFGLKFHSITFGVGAGWVFDLWSLLSILRFSAVISA